VKQFIVLVRRHTHTYTHIHTRTHTYIYTHTHTHTYIHGRTHTYTHTHTCTHTYTYAHTRTHYAHIHIHTYAHIHIYIYTHTHSYIQTYTHYISTQSDTLDLLNAFIGGGCGFDSPPSATGPLRLPVVDGEVVERCLGGAGVTVGGVPALATGGVVVTAHREVARQRDLHLEPHLPTLEEQQEEGLMLLLLICTINTFLNCNKIVSNLWL